MSLILSLGSCRAEHVRKDLSISVIVANYNGAAYLAEALNSVLNQTSLVEELIFVDDCSTDESLDIAYEVQQSARGRMKIICHEENRGQSAGFNTGFRASSGALISFLDSDDVWFENRIEIVRQIHAMSGDSSIVQHGMEIMDGTKATGRPYRRYQTCGDLVEYWRREETKPDFSPTSGLMFTRGALEKVLDIPERIRICSDAYLTRAAMLWGAVQTWAEPLAYYRVHSRNHTAENISHNNKSYYLKEIQPCLYNYYAENGVAFPDLERRKRIVEKLLDLNLRMLSKKSGFAWRRLLRSMRRT